MFNRNLFNRTVFTHSRVRSYSSSNYDYITSPFVASMITIGSCFLTGTVVRNDIDSLYRQQEEIKKILKEIKESK